MKLRELAVKLGAAVSGADDIDITGAAGVREAIAGNITFIEGVRYLKDLQQSGASAAIVPPDTPDMPLPLLRVKNPRLAFARTLELFYVAPYRPSGISDKAAIGKNVIIGADCSIHAFAFIADNVIIGERVTIHPGVYIGEGSVIGDDSAIHANASIGHGISVGKRVLIHSGAVLGSDGFGFVTEGGRHHKIPQVGGVIIEDDVEIGANCSIDRATLGNTMIKGGAKLDNQVHIAHNVTIGEHCLLAGQVGIAGSSALGSYVVLGGQAGVGDHLTVGDRVMAGGKSVITKNVEAGQVIAGFYAMPIRDWLKVQAVLPKLPELNKIAIRLEQRIQKLEQMKTEDEGGSHDRNQ